VVRNAFARELVDWSATACSALARSGPVSGSRPWGNRHNINVNQLAIWSQDSPHPPFLMYRIKEASAAFAQTSGYFPNSVPCFSAADGVWTNSPISNAADGTTMGSHVPITITCDVHPGQLTEADLDRCLHTLIATNPEWGPDGANCTP
jgi:hypothetical protein